MKPIKVVHIINNLEIGGAEKALLTNLQGFKKYHPEVENFVICLNGGGPLVKNVKELGISCRIYNYRLFVPFFSKLDVYVRLGLISYIKSIKPDIIHGHLLVGEDFAKMSGAILNIPVVNTVHDVMIWPGLKQRILNRYIATTVAVSNVVKNHILKTYRLPADSKDVVVIPNAIDFAEFASSKKIFNIKKPVFIYIGRLLKSKGIDYVIRGLAEIINDYPGLEFHIYGKEASIGYSQYLKNLADKNGYNFVKFMGISNDVPTALSTGDIFVIASESEGFAIAALEAAAASKPIIATKTGSMADMIKDGENGCFVEYGSASDVEKAARKILAVGVEKMGKKSREMNINAYSVEKNVKMYYNLYLKIVSSRGKI